MENTTSHETVYNLAHRTAKANPWSDYYPTFHRLVTALIGIEDKLRVHAYLINAKIHAIFGWQASGRLIDGVLSYAHDDGFSNF